VCAPKNLVIGIYFVSGLQVYKHRRLQEATSLATTTAHGNALRIRSVVGENAECECVRDPILICYVTACVQAFWVR